MSLSRSLSRRAAREEGLIAPKPKFRQSDVSTTDYKGTCLHTKTYWVKTKDGWQEKYDICGRPLTMTHINRNECPLCHYPIRESK
jgi:hypothetical protein